MDAILPFFLGALFGLLSAMPLGYLLLRMLFLFRPLPSTNLQTFHRASAIGLLALVPPLFFVGFVISSVTINDASVDRVQLSSEIQRLFALLALIGVLAQCFLGQRLSLVSDERLVIERVFLGTVQSVARSDISAVELYKRAWDHPHAKIRLNLKDGRALRLLFGEHLRSDLEKWLNQD